MLQLYLHLLVREKKINVTFMMQETNLYPLHNKHTQWLMNPSQVSNHIYQNATYIYW